MIIAISGLTGCGKNTLGELLAKKLGYKLVCPTFKDLAEREGVSLMEFQERAKKDRDIDKRFDAMLKEEAQGDCVVTTWLGPWIVDADLRIRLNAPLETRAERIAERDGMKLEDALQHVKERDEGNRERYKRIYNIDIYDESVYDATLDSGKYRPEELLVMVLEIIEKRG